MERQRAGHGREQPRSIGGGDDHARWLEGDRGEPAGVHLVDEDLILGREGSGARRPGLAGEHAIGPGDQLGHQPGFPRAPGGGAGGAAVGLGQRAQQVQCHLVPGRTGHIGDRRRVVEVAPGGGIGEEEMVPHHVHQSLDVVGTEPHACGHGADELHPHLGVVARVPLADVVQQGAD